MKKYIDQSEAYKRIKHEADTHELNFYKEAYERAARIIAQMPAVEAEPVRHGLMRDSAHRFYCPECYEDAEWRDNYCRNCGFRFDDPSDVQGGGADNDVD